MKKILQIVTILLLLAGMMIACGKENNEDNENPYRENIIGKWKLVEIITIVGYGNQNIDTVDYSNANIIYDFQNDSILIITGYVPDDLSEGMHTYRYGQPPHTPLDAYDGNFSIDNMHGGWCNAKKKEQKMTIDMEIIPILQTPQRTAELNNATRIVKMKTFIKSD
ncbi:MAG: hypothetical protein LBK94_00260 [Prevotellaceae bacterium]|jgi:hypothetical protein|nr:hypothetical protein [Prevotellaceae bacterium]